MTRSTARRRTRYAAPRQRGHSRCSTAFAIIWAAGQTLGAEDAQYPMRWDARAVSAKHRRTSAATLLDGDSPLIERQPTGISPLAIGPEAGLNPYPGQVFQSRSRGTSISSSRNASVSVSASGNVFPAAEMQSPGIKRRTFSVTKLYIYTAYAITHEAARALLRAPRERRPGIYRRDYSSEC
jgi:hypothetical protein